MLVAKMGQDGHDRGQKVIATAFADLGFDVTSARCSRRLKKSPGRQWKTTCTWSASSLAAGHKTLVPELRGALKKLGREDIMIVAGGVIPAG